MTTTYLDTDTFRTLSVLPSEFIDEVEGHHPGWVQAQIDQWSRWLESRLRKRYSTPFAAHDATPPTPPAIQGWLVRIVSLRVLLRRGVDPNDIQVDMLKEDADMAMAEVKEASDSDVGMFDLPLRAMDDRSAVNRGGPRVYSESSPYRWATLQRERGRKEDRRD